MKDTITVDILDLLNEINELKNSGCKFIELAILDQEDDDDEIIPANLVLTGYKTKDKTYGIEADYIEEIDFD